MLHKIEVAARFSLVPSTREKKRRKKKKRKRKGRENVRDTTRKKNFYFDCKTPTTKKKEFPSFLKNSLSHFLLFQKNKKTHTTRVSVLSRSSFSVWEFGNMSRPSLPSRPGLPARPGAGGPGGAPAGAPPNRPPMPSRPGQGARPPPQPTRPPGAPAQPARPPAQPARPAPPSQPARPVPAEVLFFQIFSPCEFFPHSLFQFQQQNSSPEINPLSLNKSLTFDQSKKNHPNLM